MHCNRCGDSKPSNCFTQSKKRCDQCISAIDEHVKLSNKAKVDALKTPIFTNYASSKHAIKSRAIRAGKDATLEAIEMLNKISFNKELQQ